MKLLIITREQAEMMDSDPINSIKLIILLIAIVVISYYLNSFYKWVKNTFKRNN